MHQPEQFRQTLRSNEHDRLQCMMAAVLTFHVGALTFFNTSKCSHASLLHPGKAGSCKQPLTAFIRGYAVFALNKSAWCHSRNISCRRAANFISK